MGFGLQSMHPLFTFNFRLIVKLIIITLPVIIVLVYVEYGLNHLDTHYLKKRIDLEKQLSSIEILSLGSSNAYFGINPSQFSCPGFNLAFNAQSMYYDLAFVEKYINSMPKLKVVILPAIFFTTGSELLGTSQDWRIYFYKQYFALPNETQKNNMTANIKRALDSRNYSKIALYADTIYGHIKDSFTGHVDYVPEKNGWYDPKEVPKMNPTSNAGLDAARAHSAIFNITTADSNIENWEKIIEILKKRNIEVLIVRLPEDKSYHENLDNNKSRVFTSKIQDFADKKVVIFADYSKNKLFTTEDFTVMPDHLNHDGAIKFSELLNVDYLKKLCSN
jgi:hypothetical protein